MTILKPTVEGEGEGVRISYGISNFDCSIFKFVSFPFPIILPIIN